MCLLHPACHKPAWVVQVVAEIPPVTAHSTASLLSSLEFNSRAQLLATAGVAKRIAIYE